ncbi:MAG: amidohydrolase [Chloroflexi bacterium]|nr:amidohydrolase [Chloroflexota bacterium]
MYRAVPDLLLYNANVITLDALNPRFSWVAISQGKIAAVGSGEPPREIVGRNVRAIDCQGGTLVPGFNDAHCHILATAASLLAVDCGPGAVSSIRDIGLRLRQRAERVSRDTWIRGTGYNEFYLLERRHPTRWDLDQWVPEHPVRLLHRSGHASVLNGRALSLAGIHRDTPDPPGGVIERDERTGEPTGLLLEMNDHLERAAPPLSKMELDQGLGLFNQECLRLGITSLQDATPGNSPERWKLLADIKRRGLLTPSVTLMPGTDHIHPFLQEGLGFGSGDSVLRVGAAKIMATLTTGAIHPPLEEMQSLMGEAQDNGFQVAIHAVEAEVLEEAIEAMDCAVQMSGGGSRRHRIEHCSECPPHLVEKLARNGMVVVTQPGFLYYNGERYLAEVPIERQPWLYAIGSLMSAGVPLAFGSDSPVIPMNPLVGVYAAATRRSESGAAVLPEEAIGVEDAMRMYTLGGAYASFEEASKGSIEAGKRADLVLLDRDPIAVGAMEIKDIRVLITVVNGHVVWER